MRTFASESSIAVGTSSGSFLGANERRLALIISSPAANPVTITTLATAVATLGLTLQKGTNPTVLHRHDVGDWITRQLNAIASGGTETLGVIEVLEA